MPPKPDLLYNETAAVMIMKYFSLVTEKIVIWSCGQGVSICAHVGLVLQILGLGLQFLYTQFVTQKLSMEQSVVQFIFLGHFPSSDNQSSMKLAWPCVILMYISHGSTKAYLMLSIYPGVTGPAYAAWTLGLNAMSLFKNCILELRLCLFTERICAHLSNAFWYEHTLLCP